MFTRDVDVLRMQLVVKIFVKFYMYCSFCEYSVSEMKLKLKFFFYIVL